MGQVLFSSNLRRWNCFFPSGFEWGVIPLNLKGREFNYLLVIIYVIKNLVNLYYYD